MRTRERLTPIQEQQPQRKAPIASDSASAERSPAADANSHAAVQRAMKSPGSLSGSDVVQLQSIVGNRGVQHLMRHEIDEAEVLSQTDSVAAPDSQEDSDSE